MERPAMQCSPLIATTRYPVANTAEFFNGDRARSGLRIVYNGLADVVVCPGGEAALLARQFAEAATAGLCALSLQLCAEAAVTVAHKVDNVALVERAVTVNRNIDNAHIDTEYTIDIARLSLINIAHGHQVELAAHIAKIGLALLGLQQFKLAITADEGNNLPTTAHPKGDGLGLESPVQHPIIVGNPAMWLKRALRFLVEFIGVCHLRDTAHDQLRRQGKRCPDIRIHEFMQGELPKSLSVPSGIAYGIASGIARLKYRQEPLPLFVRG